MNAAETLARAFAALLRRDIGDQWPAMLAAHRKSPDRLNGRSCVTHDYCDANQTMLDAWVEAFAVDPDIDDEEAMQIVDSAWCMAKAADFYEDDAEPLARRTVAVKISDADAVRVAEFLEVYGQRTDSTHGPLTVETLAAMLLEDVALTISRPGSWEGANMATVLGAHGYPL